MKQFTNWFMAGFGVVMGVSCGLLVSLFFAIMFIKTWKLFDDGVIIW